MMKRFNNLGDEMSDESLTTIDRQVIAVRNFANQTAELVKNIDGTVRDKAIFKGVSFAILDSAEEYIKNMESAKMNQWINLKDKTPGYGNTVILYHKMPLLKNMAISIGFQFNTGEWVTSSGEPISYPPTHWMAIPEPPKG